jgi:tetratricopeptide (TPR) repeat protein
MLRPVGWLLAVTLTTLPAYADNKSDASQAFGEGKTKYAKGNYADAANDFKRAYDLDPDPAYLFNLAQAYRLADDCVNAEPRYRKFLEVVPNPPNKEAVQGWLDEAKKCAASKAPPPPKDPVLPPPPPPDPIPPKDTPKGKGIPVAAITSFAVGAVGIVVGVVYTSKVGKAEDDAAVQINLDLTEEMGGCVRDPMMTDACDGKLLGKINDRGDRAQLFAITGYAVGGAAVIAGGVLLFMRRNKTEKSIAIAPSKGGAMVVTGFRF